MALTLQSKLALVCRLEFSLVLFASSELRLVRVWRCQLVLVMVCVRLFLLAVAQGVWGWKRP